MGDTIPWSILLPVAGAAGVAVFQVAGLSLRWVQTWAVITLGMCLVAFTFLSRLDVSWTQIPLAITSAAMLFSVVGITNSEKRSANEELDESLIPRAVAFMLLSLTALAVTCHVHSLSGLLAGHAGFLIAGTGVSRIARQSDDATNRYLVPMSITLMAAGCGILFALGGSEQLEVIARTLQNAYFPEREELTVGTPSILGVLSFVLIAIAASIPFGTVVGFSGQAIQFREAQPWLVLWQSIAGRAYGFVLLWRIAVATLPGFGSQVQIPLLILAVASGLAGAFLACRSSSLRELAANCWLLHAGLLLQCIATGAGQVSLDEGDGRWQIPSSLETGILILGCSSAALIVLLFAETSLALPDRRQHFDEDLAGLVRQRPSTGGALATALLAFCALPPVASFWGLLYLGAGALMPQLEAEGSDVLVPNGAVVLSAAALVISLLILTSRIARVLSLMFFEDPIRRHEIKGGPALLVAGALSASLLMCGLLPGPMLRAIHTALRG